MRNKIVEYPYSGTISRLVEGEGRAADTTEVIYDGVMDEHMVSDENGRTLQTASYIISIPLKKDEIGEWIVPRKGDKIRLTRYGETFELTIDNAMPSQLGGISIYATRNSW